MAILGHIEIFLDPVAKINCMYLYTGGPELSIQVNHSKNLHTISEIQPGFPGSSRTAGHHAAAYFVKARLDTSSVSLRN